eukprot:9631866-Alexandrium_andersonii.AAC.1
MQSAGVDQTDARGGGSQRRRESGGGSGGRHRKLSSSPDCSARPSLRELLCTTGQTASAKQASGAT